MSVRVHTTDVTSVAIWVLNHDGLNDFFGGIYDHDDIEQALVLNDDGNMEAMVLVGTDAELLAFTDAIREKLGLIPAVDHAAEQALRQDFNPED